MASDTPAMSGDSAAPIVSTLAGDASAHERIEKFVVALGETIDRLQDLELAGEFKQLETEVVRVGQEATLLGFGPLALAAAAVERHCAAMTGNDGNPERVRDALVAITDVARRIRLGHRGMAYY